MRLLDIINEKTNNAYKNFKLVSVIFDKKQRECVFKFLYKDEIKNDDKETLKRIIEEFLNQDVQVVIKCKKAYIDADLVRDILYNFIIRNFASIAVNFKKENINVEIDDSINVTITCNDFIYKYMISNNIKEEIMAYADGFFFEPFGLEITKTENEVIKDISLQDSFDFSFDDDSQKLKFIKIENVKKCIGETNNCPVEISSLTGASDNIEIAGEIKFFTQKSFESKRKDKNGENIMRYYYSFILSDGKGKINCVLFPNKADMLKASQLKDGDIVVCHGATEDFNGRFNFKATSVSYCDIVKEEEIEEIVSVKSAPNEKYLVAFPEPYVELFQDNLFAKSDEIGQYLLDNDVVVFDIETTGLEASRCEILEIGAVKIHNGKKIETFETFVKPTTKIPEEIINLTGITDDMVKNAPNISKVIADFYKFCYGCTIIAYNIDFDYRFINQFGKKHGYIFDNKQIDALYLARAFIPGLKNFKLGTVCKKLEVSLENAHRAVHDAMATADVVIKLSPHIT